MEWSHSGRAYGAAPIEFIEGSISCCNIKSIWEGHLQFTQKFLFDGRLEGDYVFLSGHMQEGGRAGNHVQSDVLVAGALSSISLGG